MVWLQWVRHAKGTGLRGKEAKWFDYRIFAFCRPQTIVISSSTTSGCPFIALLMYPEFV